jgi:hypothetical protein
MWRTRRWEEAKKGVVATALLCLRTLRSSKLQVRSRSLFWTPSVYSTHGTHCSTLSCLAAVAVEVVEEGVEGVEVPWYQPWVCHLQISKTCPERLPPCILYVVENNSSLC